LRLHRRGPEPARGDLVIGAFVLARLLGIRLLTLEAQVVVHGGDRDGSGAIVLSPARPDDRALGPAGPARRVRLERPARPGDRAGSDLLARAVQLADEGADTLERTRRAQYRG
jgi:hypothetical protein